MEKEEYTNNLPKRKEEYEKSIYNRKRKMRRQNFFIHKTRNGKKVKQRKNKKYNKKTLQRGLGTGKTISLAVENDF